MKIGLPKALLYYKYNILWKNFFKNLDIETITSSNTNKTILTSGVKSSSSEACLSFKIFLGHIEDLKNKCDYILVPRISSFSKNEVVCTKFNALYDICTNTYKDIKFISYNVDGINKIYEKDEFIKLGMFFNKTKKETERAYIKALFDQKKYNEEMIQNQYKKLRSKKMKILISGHPYNIYDDFIGSEIINFLKENDIEIIYSHIIKEEIINKECENISKTLYWTYNKELLAGINLYGKHVNGIMLLSTFPCGTDSLTNELVLKKIKNKPIINIIVDENNSNTGVITRLESFIDIIKMKEEI